MECPIPMVEKDATEIRLGHWAFPYRRGNSQALDSDFCYTADGPVQDHYRQRCKQQLEKARWPMGWTKGFFRLAWQHDLFDAPGM